ncbi:YhjD/YihY/BrkB family envelope integrity protein [Halogeometricum luteum]|uniref:YihY/virulence factor BrkB family protein n=1 Tax=Halogeometricum luteum TaxID=2950537 RepID=A0ABU2G2K1_9EURY|nr:YhjD/YihY/BrkB family envelope integrity protein [Halogeometricum sp. S3BR5-2]MDS0294538.1 YihY/virulence factor BrkB family protein [Halogeometricum sp. S3BR5-2]
MPRPDTAVETVRTVVEASYEHRVQYPAAALAYYAFASLLPVLVLLLVVVGRPVVEPVREATAQFLTPGAQRLVSRALSNSAGKAGATLFAVVVLVWSAANVTAGFETVVARVEDSAHESPSGRLGDAVTILVSVGLSVGSVVAASALFVLLPSVVPAAAGLGSLFVALSVVLLPLYYVPTSELPSPTAALPGAVTAALGWTTLLAAVRFYIANAAAYAVFGVLSVVLLVLSSLYLAAVVLMLGFVVNATLSTATTAAGSA